MWYKSQGLTMSGNGSESRGALAVWGLLRKNLRMALKYCESLVYPFFKDYGKCQQLCIAFVPVRLVALKQL